MQWMLRTPVVVSALCFLFSTSANAQTQYVKELKKYEANNELTPFFQKLMSLEPFKRLPEKAAIEEIREILDWLRLRGFYDNESARYTYAYAAWLWNAGFKDTASVMYFFAGIKARSDGARCADKSSPPDRIMQYEMPLREPIIQFLRTQSTATKEQMFRLATLRIEERLPLRQPDEWLCNGGMAFFKKYADKHGNLNGKEMAGSSENIGKVVVVEDNSIKPDFVDNQAWQADRRVATDSAIANLRKFLFETTSNSAVEKDVAR